MNRFLLQRLSNFVAFCVDSVIWLLKLSLLSSLTPRYLSFWINSSGSRLLGLTVRVLLARLFMVVVCGCGWPWCSSGEDMV